MIVVRFTDLTPEPRDDQPWTSALIQESDAQDGTFVTIATETLDPVDSDPKNPLTRAFTTEAATQQNGWYRVVWQDSDDDTSTTPPFQNLTVARAYRPLVSDVAALMRDRTSVQNVEQGTFTPQTRPKFQEAADELDRAMRKLEARFGPEMPAELVGSATEVVRLRAAMMLELSLFSDQIRPDRSRVDALTTLYDAALADFLLERKELGADDIPGDADDLSGAGLPAYSFPQLGGFGVIPCSTWEPEW